MSDEDEKKSSFHEGRFKVSREDAERLALRLTEDPALAQAMLNRTSLSLDSTLSPRTRAVTYDSEAVTELLAAHEHWRYVAEDAIARLDARDFMLGYERLSLTFEEAVARVAASKLDA